MKKLLFILSLILLAGTTGLSAQNTEESTNTVTIVKFSDYQCPACAYYIPMEKRLKEEFGSKVEIVTKHFPLSMHQYAALASRAAEAARAQGMYQEMHYKIFAGQPVWSKGNAEAIFKGYAEDLNLDMDQFEEDLNSMETQRKVMQGRREGVQKGVRGTPAFFINGKQIEPLPNNYFEFRQIVTNYLKSE